MLIFGLLLIAAVTAYNVACAVKPEIQWKLFERWKSYRADEPSDLYLLMTRVGAAVGAVIGTALIVAILYMAMQPEEEPVSFEEGDFIVRGYDAFGSPFEDS